MKAKTSRRDFLGAAASVAGAAAGFAALADPIQAAAQSVGVKPADLPDLTIKEVKIYVTDLKNYHSLNGERGELVSIVTKSGIEGNYRTLTGWGGTQFRRAAILLHKTCRP